MVRVLPTIVIPHFHIGFIAWNITRETPYFIGLKNPLLRSFFFIKTDVFRIVFIKRFFATFIIIRHIMDTDIVIIIVGHTSLEGIIACVITNTVRIPLVTC